VDADATAAGVATALLLAVSTLVHQRSPCAPGVVRFV
jgi:hypothetical protein